MFYFRSCNALTHTRPIDAAACVYNRELRRIQVINHQRLAPVLALAALLFVGCGGAAVPQDQLSSAEAAARAAEVGGAPNNPKAALHLKYARDQISEAKKLIEEDENERAAAVLSRAEMDAELALALARVDQARAEAQAAIDEVKELRAAQARQPQ
jgi:hypothetical protein